MQIPDLQQSHAFQSGHIESVTLDRALHGSGPLAPIQAIFAPGYVYACHQALEIPFPRTDGHLVKIIQVEDTSRCRVP